MKWTAINTQSGLICIQESYCKIAQKHKDHTKSGKHRYVPVSHTLTGFLERLRKHYPGSEFLIPFFHPDRYNPEFKRLSRSLGLKEIRFHDLRHTFASNFLMGGGNIYDLQKILGHSTIQVTERYGHLIPDRLKGKTEVLSY